MKLMVANKGDFDAIKSLHNHLFPDDLITDLTLILNDSSYRYFIAKNEEVMAYISYQCVDNECDMLFIAVKEVYRNKKVGTSLLSYSMSELEKSGIKMITLEVRKSNVGAINLYLKNNFVKISERRSYYTNPIEDAIVYRWEAKIR